MDFLDAEQNLLVGRDSLWTQRPAGFASVNGMPIRLYALSSLLLLLTPGCVTGGSLGGDDDDMAIDDDDDDDDDTENTDPALWPETLGGDRVARVKWPSNYSGGLLPVVIQLHGYTGSGQWARQWPQLDGHIDGANIILVTGEGNVDAGGDRFWNATDACCDLYGSGVDDVAWLTSVLDEVIDNFPVDQDRVYFTGLSNGGFMSYRMACELSERVAAIASVAGMDFADEDACVPTQPVSVLHIHGTNDGTVPYNGASQGWSLPSAPESVKRWAGRAGCDVDEVTDEGPADYVTNLAGAETDTQSWLTGCDEGRSAALWTINGGSHVPNFNSSLGEDLLDWLLRHSL